MKPASETPPAVLDDLKAKPASKASATPAKEPVAKPADTVPASAAPVPAAKSATGATATAVDDATEKTASDLSAAPVNDSVMKPAGTAAAAREANVSQRQPSQLKSSVKSLAQRDQSDTAATSAPATSFASRKVVDVVVEKPDSTAKDADIESPNEKGD